MIQKCINSQKRKNRQNRQKDNIPLQVHCRLPENHENHYRKKENCWNLLQRKTFCCAFRGKKASLTVEAAFLMPMLVFLMAGFSFVILLIGLQVKLQESLDGAGRKLAAYAYVYDRLIETEGKEEELKKKQQGVGELLSYGLTHAYAWKLIRDDGGEDWLNDFFLWNEENGILITGENVMSEKDIIDLVLRYAVRIPFLPGKQVTFPVVQRCRIKAWTGYEKKSDKKTEEAEEIVYITKTGSVYHRNRNCTSLNLSIRAAGYDEVSQYRNSSGAKYYACELCVNKNNQLEEGDFVYITKTGTAYHCDRNCSGLKRTIMEIGISQVGSRTECKRCGGTQ